MERLLDLNRARPAARADGEVRQVPLESLHPNPDQPRRSRDEAAISELADSIRSQGVIQPLLVRPMPGEAGAYQVVVGERRFVAAGRAGLTSVPCIVRSLDDREVFILSVAENVAREDLNPVDEAAAYRRMLDERYAANQGEIAELIGVHRSRVSRKLKLLSLDPRIQDQVRSQPPGAISLTHLEELSRLKPGDDQFLLFRTALKHGLSTRELHSRIDDMLAPRRSTASPVSKSIIPLDGGARIAVYPNKYVLRVPREPGDQVDLARIVSDLEGVLAQLRSRLEAQA